jgi:type III restriction enzyme
MFELKNYQRTTLDVLAQFLEDAQVKGPMQAYVDSRQEHGISNALYRTNGLGEIPYICLRLPTGGGKTILASYAIRDVANKYLNRDKLLVMWLVPTTKIAEQTLDCLKKPGHPYRQAIDEYFGGKVSVFAIGDVVNIRPQDLEQKVCVVVGTLATLRITDTTGRRIYAHNENYKSHFDRLKISLTGLELIEDGEDKGKPKYSFANLCYLLKPLVIMDEAHNARTGLSFETLKRISPSCVIELTATPDVSQNSGSNVLHSVSALELKNENMIKLPIMLTEHASWEQAVANTVLKRNELAEIAKTESRYLRPIALYQAEDKNKPVTFEVLKKYLIESENISESKIAIYTGDIKELDGINLFDKNCTIEHIITVEALKEGWDCSFAYVFCSVANISSSKDVEQLLGRVLRMPDATRQKNDALNCAYANVTSPNFSKAAQDLRDALVSKMGFEPLEALTFVDSMNKQDSDNKEQTEIFDQPEPETIEVEGLNVDALSDDSKKALNLKTENGKTTIEIKPEIDRKTEEELMKALPEHKLERIKKSIATQRLGKTSIPKKGVRKDTVLKVPRLCRLDQGEVDFLESDSLLDAGEWNVLDYKAELPEFIIEENGHTFEITISKNKIVTLREDQTEQYYISAINPSDYSDSDLIIWLDRETHQQDIRQVDSLAFIRRIIEYLKDNKHYNIIQLYRAKFQLRAALIYLIDKYRKEAKKRGYQKLVFENESNLDVSFSYCLEYKPGNENYLPNRFYNGNIAFNKHFYEQIGDMNKEEEECARAIDRLPLVKYWVRNIEKQPRFSFWLPTSSDKFYPDFVAELTDGRILVLEYKGSMIATSDDTKEKNDIGKLWEKKSNGKGTFIMCTKDMIKDLASFI